MWSIPPIREIGGDIVHERALAEGPVIEGLRARETAAATPAVKVREDKPARRRRRPLLSMTNPRSNGKPGKAKGANR